MLSRARNALILIGNSETLTGSAKGGELWKQVMSVLRTNGHVYDGLPTRCEQHPVRTALLRYPADFDEVCPDGGCQEPWLVVPNVQRRRLADEIAVQVCSIAECISALNAAISSSTIVGFDVKALCKPAAGLIIHWCADVSSQRFPNAIGAGQMRT